MSTQGRTVVVAGGGIAGMAAALLAKSGTLVTVLERVAAPEAVGAGLVLQPNGLAVLPALRCFVECVTPAGAVRERPSAGWTGRLAPCSRKIRPGCTWSRGR